MKRQRALKLRFVRPRIEELESRLTPAFAPGAVLSLELVTLHEFGHALGLRHFDSAPSIMNSAYNPDYSINAFLNGEDPAIAELQSLYSGDNVAAGLSPWRDEIDALPGNNVIDLTYNFISQSSGGISFVDMMNQQFGDPSGWEPIFARVADYWSAASGGTLIIAFAENGSLPAGFRGNIAIGASTMDGPGGVLAVGAEPPSGEINFDADEVFGTPVLFKFMDDKVSTEFGDPGDGEGDGGEGHEHFGLRVPIINMPRQFIAMHEASGDLHTLTVFSDLNPVRVIQVQIQSAQAALPQSGRVLVANVGWGQHSQADLYKVVFLPVLPTDTASETAEAVPDTTSPQQNNEPRPDATAPVRNDSSVQTQTPQLPQQDSSRDEEPSEEMAAGRVFDAGTALAGLALFLGGYWTVPQEEQRRRNFNR